MIGKALLVWENRRDFAAPLLDFRQKSMPGEKCDRRARF
jgi:hypothetical protein